jgi:Protein of unknown function (DUF3108)
VTPPTLLLAAARLTAFLAPLRALPEDGAPRPAADPPSAARVAQGSLALELAAGVPVLTVPADEELTFAVVVDLGILGEPTAGTVTLASGVYTLPPEDAADPDGADTAGSSDPAADPQGGRMGWIRGRAYGSHLGFTLDQRLDVRVRPTGWPRLEYSDVQAGSRNRSRIVCVGTRDGREVSTYRKDHHCNEKGCKRPEHMVKGRFLFEKDFHCPGCRRSEHRVWRDPVEREVPADTFDLLSAVYLARSMLSEDKDEAHFHLIDCDDLWGVTLVRGERRTLSTPAGRFEAREIRLIPDRPEGEDLGDQKKFEGLFGMHGSIRMWFHATTGVPVRVEGSVPLGPFDIGVSVELVGYRGTPPAFQPVP